MTSYKLPAEERETYNASAVRFFMSYLHEIVSMVEESPLFSDTNTSFDVAPLLYVVFDYAAASARKDRVTICSSIATYYLEDEDEDSVSWFYQRADFYGQIIRGKRLCCFCAPGLDVSAYNDNPLVRLTIAFCDCLINPELYDSYDNEPVRLHGVLELAPFFQNVIRPLAEYLTAAFKDVYDKV